jgi:hypothetical protein
MHKIYEVIILKFNNPLCVELFCLPKDSKKILSSTPLVYSFQNSIIHQVVLTFCNHTPDNESIIFNSLSFLFGQIFVRFI